MEDRVADLRARWTPEATVAAVALLESRPVAFDLPTMEHDGVTYLDLRGLRIEETQVDKAYLKNVNLRWALFRDVGFKNARFVNCNLSQAAFKDCYLRRAQFEKCDLVNSHFESCDFSQAAIVESRIDFASFKNCEVRLEAIRFRKDASAQAMVRVCRSLKLNAMSMGNFADAGHLTYLEKTQERRALRARGDMARWLGSLAQSLVLRLRRETLAPRALQGRQHRHLRHAAVLGTGAAGKGAVGAHLLQPRCSKGRSASAPSAC